MVRQWIPEAMQPNPVVSGFATIAEASNFLKLSRAKIYLLMESGRLAYAKVDRSRRIPWRALVEFAEQALVTR